MHLHIVSFNVPYPADYGGVIDVFYRVKALKDLGVKIHLHCYTYGRQPAKELSSLCEEVFYYKRATYPWKLLSKRPYITSSRCSQRLIDRLLQDDYPILLEGLHNAWVLEQIKDSNRVILLRAHNVEHDYYSRLAEVEPRFLKRQYLAMDARKLRQYEPVMLKATAVLAVTKADADHFRKIGCKNVALVPSSFRQESGQPQMGKGDYAIYHANLSVPENIEAAHFLINEVFSKTTHRLILAGRNPDSGLNRSVERFSNITLIANPDDTTMNNLVANAQVNILYTNQPTGLKLKLLNSLQTGRYCLVNEDMVAGTDLGEVCQIANTPAEMLKTLDRLMQQEFTQAEIDARMQLMQELYSNKVNAQKVVRLAGLQ